MFGELLGGLANLGFGIADRLGGDNSNRYNKWLNANRIQMLVADARKAGIHPLAALGASWSPNPIMPSSMGGGDAIGQGLAGLGGAIDSLYADDADRKERAALRAREDEQERYNRRRDAVAASRAAIRASQEERLNEAQIRLMEAQSRSMLAQARAAAQGATMGGNYPLPAMKPRRQVAYPMENVPYTQAATMSAQEAEDRYHELGGFVQGMSNAVQDWMLNNWARLKRFQGPGPLPDYAKEFLRRNKFR